MKGVSKNSHSHCQCCVTPNIQSPSRDNPCESYNDERSKADDGDDVVERRSFPTQRPPPSSANHIIADRHTKEARHYIRLTRRTFIKPTTKVVNHFEYVHNGYTNVLRLSLAVPCPLLFPFVHISTSWSHSSFTVPSIPFGVFLCLVKMSIIIISLLYNTTLCTRCRHRFGLFSFVFLHLQLLLHYRAEEFHLHRTMVQQLGGGGMLWRTCWW